MASVVTLIVVQSALWRHGIKPTPVHASSTLSSTNPPPAKTISNLPIVGDIILESERNIGRGAIPGNATEKNEKEAELHTVDIISSFNEGKTIKTQSKSPFPKPLSVTTPETSPL
jgi:hypothetical protein